MTSGRASRVAIALATVAAASCGEVVQPHYDLEIISGAGVDPFAQAVRVVVAVGGNKTIDHAITPGQPFDLTLDTGVPPSPAPAAIVTLDAFDGGGALVAHGETPAIELQAQSMSGFRILVQPPGTFADLTAYLHFIPRAEHVAVAARHTSGLGAVVVGTGLVYAPSDAGAPEVPDDALGAYNPVSHSIDGLGTAATKLGMSQPRRAASGLALPDGRALMFGGQAMDPMRVETVTSHVEIYSLLRTVNFGFARTTELTAFAPAGLEAIIARADAAAAHVPGPPDWVYVFGGRDLGGTALGTAVAIATEPTQSDVFQVVQAMDGTPLAMNAPRLGLTATTVVSAGGPAVLLFGGAPPTGPVAELFEAGPPARFTALAGAGEARTGHAAVALDESHVILIGGVGSGGPLASAAIYDAGSRTFDLRPAFLAEARTGAAAFLIGDDLVVAGGRGAAGLLATAEIFDRASLAPAGTVPVRPRQDARVAPLPNRAVLALGGKDADGHPVATVEIYQPRRLAMP